MALPLKTAYGVLAFATAFGLPTKYVPGILFWTMIPGLVGYAEWIRRPR